MSEAIIDDIIPYEKLNTSTETVMIYTNIFFTINSNTFTTFPITPIQTPLTKNKKNIDKKLLVAPYGAIINVQFGIYYRGVRMSRRKKYWCPKCQLYNKKKKKQKTVEEECHWLDENDEYYNIFPCDTKKIWFKCNICKTIFNKSQLRKIIPFLNQITIVISVGNILINAMVFKNSCKLAGAKSIEDAIQTMMILWEEYIQPHKQLWSFEDNQQSLTIANYHLQQSLLANCNPDLRVNPSAPLSYCLKEENEISNLNLDNRVNFLFDLVMKNVDFKLNFSIDKKKLNILMNNPEYNNYVFLSQWEATSATHVNIKMHTKIPDDFRYNILVYENGEAKNPYFIQSQQNIYAKKKKRAKCTTFIVFSAMEIILTGRYDSCMKEAYNFFVNATVNNKEQISEKVCEPKMPLDIFLKNE